MPAPINPAAFMGQPQPWNYGNPYSHPQPTPVPQYQPYVNPNWQQPNQAQSPNPSQSQGLHFVSGINEAKVYPSDGQVLLFDKSESIMYLKDGNNVRTFKYVEFDQNDPGSSNFVTHKEFDELKQLVDDLTK